MMTVSLQHRQRHATRNRHALVHDQLRHLHVEGVSLLRLVAGADSLPLVDSAMVPVTLAGGLVKVSFLEEFFLLRQVGATPVNWLRGAGSQVDAAAAVVAGAVSTRALRAQLGGGRGGAEHADLDHAASTAGGGGAEL